MLTVIVLALTCVVNLLLGSLVLIRNPRLKSSRAFFLISFFISSWAVCNYLTGSESLGLAWNNVANRLAFFTAFLAIAFGLRFTVEFIHPVYMGFGKVLDKLFTALGVSVALLSLTSLISGEVSRTAVHQLRFSNGRLLPLYVGVYLLFICLIVYALLRIMLIKRGREKQQAFFILIGFSTTPLLGLITNAILPSITSSWKTAAIGPLFTVLLVGTVSYAIIRHRLFDIRLVVVRSLGYVMSILAIVGIYSVFAFGLLSTVFNFHIALNDEIVLAIFSGLAALLFQPLKKFFDVNSNKLFYRDAYDAQSFFNQFNKALVSTIDLNQLLEESSKVIAANIKAEYCVICIKDGDSREYRIVGTAKKVFLPQDVQAVRKITPSINQSVIVTDYLENDRGVLKEILSRNNIALLARLTVNHRSKSEGMGYVLLGDKKSGNPYNDQDMKIIDTLSDELLIAIQNALRFEEIERFNETLQQKVNLATKQLRESNRKLKKLNDTKDDFIGMASHQLRTPLTSVKGYLSLVLDGDAGTITDTQRKLLQQAFTSSQRVIFLIADLLNVSRLKTGKFVIERIPTNLSKMIVDEIGQLREAAAARNIAVEFKKPAHFPTLPLDEAKTRQVVMNFLDNAIYYGRNGGHITIELHDLPQSVELRVIDDGIGVPKAEQHQLWTKFYRAKNAQKARPDGTGLGLYMAKKVIVAQGGGTIFDSVEGQGSTFGFTFPKDMPLETVTTPIATTK